MTEPAGQPHPYKYFFGDLVERRVATQDFLADGPLSAFPDRTPGDGPAEAPLFVPVPRRWGVSDLVNEIGRFLDDDAAESDVIVFRTHGSDGEELLENEAATGYLSGRANRRAWLLELRESVPRLIDIVTGKPALDPPSEAQQLALLRECELNSYIAAPGVYLESSETFHYVAPNEKHYRAFLRVGSMLRSLDVVDALCFWLVPRLGSARAVLLDSASILSVGLRSEAYTAEAQGREPGDRLGVDTLRRYREDEVTLGARLKRFLPSGEGAAPRLVFLESVASSGGLIEYIRETCGKNMGFEVEAVPVFATVAVARDRNLAPLCHLGEVSDALEEPCPLCLSGSQRVSILPSTYTLEVAADVQRASLTINDAKRGEQYLTDYAGTDCVALHRTEAESKRHHMIYIDGGELLASSSLFKRRFGVKLKAWRDQVGAVLTPDHPAARKLGEYAGRRLGRPVLHMDEGDLPDSGADVGGLDEPWLEALRSCPGLLLVDDVVITGGRLRRYLNELQPLFDAVPELTLLYLVGIARPPHRDSLANIPAMLRGRGSFEAVEEIVLPHWGRAHCPWCQELEEIRRFEAAGGQIDGALRERYERLSDVGRGLRGNEILLPWKGGEVAGLERSVFGEGTDAELFLSIAAAVQALRNEGRLHEEFRPPAARVLNARQTFDERYFEYRLQSLILRACRPHDLNSVLVRPELIGVLKQRLAGDKEPSQGDPRSVKPALREQRSELVLAAAQDKLPREWLVRGGDSDAEQQWIDHVLNGGEPSIGRLLRAALERSH